MPVVVRLTPGRLDGQGRREYDIPASTCDVCGAQARVIVVYERVAGGPAAPSSAYCATHTPTHLAPHTTHVMEAAPVSWHVERSVLPVILEDT